MKLPNSIKMVVSDFDGIFTDNSIYINPDKTISRKVNFKDIMGVSLLCKNGYKVAFISGEKNSAIELIAEKFHLQEIHQDIRNKLTVLKEILERNNLTPEEILYIGDDVNDIECLEYAKTKITVQNANKKVKKIKDIQITESYGGDGAFREVVDTLLEN
ncbi:MAG: KdsC family phosphatase [Candidatus Gastranaerophilaceae bacterium]